jgi:ankyrin repeat protein
VSRHEKIEAMRILIAGGADLNAQNNYDTTPLHLAIREIRGKAVTLLLNHGADPNLRDNRGKVSALRAAAMAGLTSRAVELIEQGENAQVTGKHKSLAAVARDAGFQETASVMQAALAKRAIDQMMAHKFAVPHG